MSPTATERRFLDEAATALAARPSSIQELRRFISTANAILERLEESNDPVASLLRSPLETFEEVYGVALYRGWAEVPASDLPVVREAVEEVRRALKSARHDPV